MLTITARSSPLERLAISARRRSRITTPTACQRRTSTVPDQLLATVTGMLLGTAQRCRVLVTRRRRAIAVLMPTSVPLRVTVANAGIARTIEASV